MGATLKKCKLGDVIELKRGYDLPKKDRTEGSVPIISSSGFSGLHNEAKVKAPGVVTGRYGTLGEVFYIEEDFWPLNTALYVKDFKGNHPRYIKYFLTQLNIAELNAAGAVPGVNRNHLHMLDIEIVKNYEDQAKIARVLENYDDLIENNNRRIAILETIAQNLYREWFINFRFPSHEQAQWQETPQGKIPLGWEVKPIADEIEILGGGTPRKSEPEYWDEELANINWFTPSDLTKSGAMFVKNSSLKITALGLQKSSAKLFPAYSVMMTSRATIGVISINTEPATTNQGFIICVPSERIGKEYIYYWLKNNMQAIDNIATGATFKEVRRTLFRELPMLIPTDEVMNLFVSKVRPVLKLIENLISKNKNLTQQRDLLLPKLITG